MSLATCENRLKSADSAASCNGTPYRELPEKQAAKVVGCGTIAKKRVVQYDNKSTKSYCGTLYRDPLIVAV